MAGTPVAPDCFLPSQADRWREADAGTEGGRERGDPRAAPMVWNLRASAPRGDPHLEKRYLMSAQPMRKPSLMLPSLVTPSRRA